jgi:hypothetical protein
VILITNIPHFHHPDHPVSLLKFNTALKDVVGEGKFLRIKEKT